MLLTPMVKIAGINSMFCKLRAIIENKIPLTVPSVQVNAEIVYPNDNPLKKIIANTTGIPITVVPANHKNNAKTIFLLIDDIINSPESTLSVNLKLSMNSVM